MDKQVKDTTVFAEHKEEGAVKDGQKARKQLGFKQINLIEEVFPPPELSMKLSQLSLLWKFKLQPQIWVCFNEGKGLER